MKLHDKVNMFIGDGDPKLAVIIAEDHEQVQVKVVDGIGVMWFDRVSLEGILPNPHMVPHRIAALDEVIPDKSETHNGLIPKQWDQQFAIDSEESLILNLEHANAIVNAMRTEGIVYRDGTIQRA